MFTYIHMVLFIAFNFLGLLSSTWKTNGFGTVILRALNCELCSSADVVSAATWFGTKFSENGKSAHNAL